MHWTYEKPNHKNRIAVQQQNNIKKTLVIMTTQSLTNAIKQFYPDGKIIATFNNGAHVAFLLIQEKTNLYLLWLPISKNITGVLFDIAINTVGFLAEFQKKKPEERITYLLENNVSNYFTDLDIETCVTIKRAINNGLHH